MTTRLTDTAILDELVAIFPGLVPGSDDEVNGGDLVQELSILLDRREPPQPKGPIHLVKAWSGQLEDETPFCGTTGSGIFGHRTIYPATATCPACLKGNRR